jgi:hypothetical protein
VLLGARLYFTEGGERFSRWSIGAVKVKMMSSQSVSDAEKIENLLVFYILINC